MDMVEEEILDEATESLWVFGYGSLCWNPGFKYSRKHIGRIRGFSRRFYQGNTTHRGIPGYPGRCATLVEDAEDVTYGVAFELEGETALTYLNQREVKLGSYGTAIAIFEATEEEGIEPFSVLMYVATPSLDANPLWLGDGPIKDIAHQVVHSSGQAGHNVEYVLKMAQWMRHTLPCVRDEHLYSLEYHIRKLVRHKGLDMSALMGEILVLDGDCPNDYCCKRISDRVRCCSTGSTSDGGASSDAGSGSDTAMAEWTDLSDCGGSGVTEKKKSEHADTCLRCIHF